MRQDVAVGTGLGISTRCQHTLSRAISTATGVAERSGLELRGESSSPEDIGAGPRKFDGFGGTVT